MEDERDLVRLTGLVYEAALDPTAYTRFLAELLGTLGCGGAGAIQIRDPDTDAVLRLYTSGWDDSAWDAYAAHYHYVEPYARHFIGVPELTARPFVSLTPPSELVRCEYYCDFLKPHGLFFEGIGAVIEKRNGALATIMGFSRGDGHTPLGPSHLALVDALLPHLARTLRLGLRLEAADRARDDLAAALDTLPQAAIVVNGESQVLRMNRRAEALIARRLGLDVTGGKLRCSTPAETHRLEALLLDAIATARGESRAGAGAMGVRGLAGMRPLALLVLPVQDAPAAARSLPGAAALVLVTDPSADPRPPADLLRALYALTPAEAGVALAIAAGRSPRAIADARAVSLHTVKSLLQRAFAKTRTSTQAGLTRAVLAAGGPAGPGAPVRPE